MKTEIVISQRKDAWKLVYCDDGIQPKGFYFVNAGETKAYSPASKDSVFNALEQLLALQGRVALLEGIISRNCDTMDMTVGDEKIAREIYDRLGGS